MGSEEATTSEESRLGDEIELRAGKLKKGKEAGKDEVIGEMIKGGGDKVVD